jgi:hypothetical protein
MIKEAFIVGLSTIVGLSGAHYRAVVPKPGNIAIYWQNVGKYLSTGVAAEAPEVEAAKQKQQSSNMKRSFPGLRIG